MRRLVRLVRFMWIAAVVALVLYVAIAALSQTPLVDNQYDDPGGLCDPARGTPNPGCR